MFNFSSNSSNFSLSSAASISAKSVPPIVKIYIVESLSLASVPQGMPSVAPLRYQSASYASYPSSASPATYAYGSRHHHNTWPYHFCLPPSFKGQSLGGTDNIHCHNGSRDFVQLQPRLPSLVDAMCTRRHPRLPHPWNCS